MGWIVADLPRTAQGFGTAQRCPDCEPDVSSHCGLNDAELALSAASIRGNGEIERTLRQLVAVVADQPAGWLTLWGSYGTAKTLTVQAIVAELVRRKKPARFIHAKRLEQIWFEDMHGDTAKAASFRDVPVLAIDEMDKTNLKSEWVRQQFQELLDHRYRTAVAGKTLTLFTVQSDPAEVLPGDIASRMGDGRFYRPWPQRCALTVERWQQVVLPGVIHVAGVDRRPSIPPAFVRR